MFEYFKILPAWFWMLVIAVIIGSISYRLLKDGIKIKVGPVEIDATEEDPSIEVTEEIKK